MLKVYYLRISDFDSFDDTSFLPDIDKKTWEAARSFKSAVVRRTKLLGESMVRKLIYRQWGLEAGAYAICRGSHGKPYVVNAGTPVYFNLSHSGNYIVCALSEREIGVDIEKRRRIKIEVGRRFFHSKEVQQLESLNGARQSDLFFRYWSVKESFLKYTGEGLSASLSGFEVCFQDAGICIKKMDVLLPVFVRECAIDPDYKCFVCSETDELPEILPYGS